MRPEKNLVREVFGKRKLGERERERDKKGSVTAGASGKELEQTAAAARPNPSWRRLS
jgi:hypothetical protein